MCPAMIHDVSGLKESGALVRDILFYLNKTPSKKYKELKAISC